MFMLLVYFFKFILLIDKTSCLMEQQPIFTSQPADVGPLFSGTRGILQCTASGTPQVQYRWLKNGQSLTNRSTSNGGVYLISQADRYKDCGTYQCIAENKLGSVLSNKAQLTVAYMDQLKVQYPVEIRVRHGRAAVIRLPKMFDAYPAPTIEWFAGGALIEPNAKFAITKDYNLVVLKCDKADEKSYYVEVSSIHTGTKIRSREIRLYIIDSYNFDDDSSMYHQSFNGGQEDYTNQESVGGDADLEFIVKPVDTIAKLNDNLVKFDCIVNSRKYALDQLEIMWYKDQQLIDFIKTKYHLSSRSLEIISVTDQDVGIYTCSARHNINPMTSSSNFFGSSLANSADNYVLINASAKLEVYIKPTFKTQPESLIETDFGKTVQLKCDGIAYPQANITWYKNAQLIDFDKQPTNLQVNDSGTRLIISNISLRDQAIYQCFLSNEAGHISASTLIKIISFAPKFTEPMQNMTVYSDANIELPCGRVDGSPRPRITWTRINTNKIKSQSDHGGIEDDIINSEENNDNNKNNHAHSSNLYAEEEFSNDRNAAAVDDEDDYYSRNRENTDLILNNVNVRHQGWYKCEASNLMGKISAKFYLLVKRKTEIIEPPMNISVTKGQSAVLKCTVSKEDDTDIELEWKFNDQLLEENDNSNLKMFRNGTLQILEAKNTDIGTYKCMVRSVNNYLAGNDSKTAYLNVVELPYAPINLNANLLSTAKRSVNLTWDASFDGNSPIMKYIVNARVTAFDKTLLQHEQTELSLYDWFVIKDNVMLGPSNYYQPSVMYASSGQHIKYSTHIDDLKPAFTYEFRVSAVNGIGEGMPSRPSNNVTVPEEIPSQPPQSIQASAMGAKTLLIQWQQPPVISWNGRLKGYRIAYSLSYPNSTWKYMQIEDYMQTSANLTDLIVWETYLIKICAFNAKGYGKYNYPPLHVRTKEGVPIRAPLHFKANALNSTCIRMWWSAPPAQFVNGLIQGYKILFYENNRTDLPPQTSTVSVNRSSATTTLLSDSQYQYQMCRLAKFTLYTMSILCFTSSGDGPATPPIQLKTLEDVPGEVSDIQFINVYDTSIDIEWRPPAQPNGRILSYIISYKALTSSSSRDNRTNKFEHVIVDASQLAFTLRNLKSSTEYLLGIRAKTQAGDGMQKLLQIKSGVPPELPEPPKAIVLRHIGQTSVELEFIPGYDGKTSINKWIVEALIVFNANANTFNEPKWSLVYEKSQAPNATKLTVANLRPFTNYTLRMLARNVKGVSRPSQATEVFQTLADVPSDTPAFVSARFPRLYANTTRINNIDLLVKWTPIPTSRWNGVPLGYVMFVSECSINAAANESIITTRHEIKFDKFKPAEYWLRGLGSFRCYTVGLAAWNSVGLGPQTPVHKLLVLNRTSQSRPSNYTYSVNLFSINATAVRVTWSKLDAAYYGGLLTGYRIKYQPIVEKILNDSRDDVINVYDNDDADNENNYDNDLAFISAHRPKEVFYRVGSAGSSFSLQAHSSEQIYELALGNLLAYTSYKIEIAACTRAGCGQFSLPVSIRTQEYLPSRPLDLHFPQVNLTSVRLEWRAPRYTNGVLIAYRIRYILKRYLESNTANQQLSWSHAYYMINSSSSSNENSNLHQIDIGGLAKREYYIFEISANNTCNKGWGDPARSIVYTIDAHSRLRPDSPAAPAIGKSSVKTNELTISWSTNSDNYSPIRFFTIQMAEITNNSTDSDYKWLTIYLYKCANIYLNNNYRLHIRGRNKRGQFIIRPNGRGYKFRVAASNDVGMSEFSLESTLARTKPDVPRLNLFDLTVKAVASNRLALQWSERATWQIDELVKFKLIYTEMRDQFVDDNLDGSNLVLNELVIDYKSTNKTELNQSSVFSDSSTMLTDDEEDEKDAPRTSKIFRHTYEVYSSALDSLGVYEFELCGINLVGQSLKCAKSQSLVYMEDRLPKIKGNLLNSVQAVSSTEIDTRWRAASSEEANGRLYAYKLVCINNELFSARLNSAISQRRALDFDISKIANNGKLSMSIAKRLFSLLNHNENRNSQVGPHLEEEQVSFSSSEYDMIDVLIVEPEQTQTILNNLRPYTNYTILVQLINQAGESVLSMKSLSELLLSSRKIVLNNHAQTLESVPSQPADLKFSYIAYTHLNLTLVQPRDPNGLLTAYELWYENMPTPNASHTQTTKIIRQEIVNDLHMASQTLFVNNLEPQMAYKFRVRCRTSIAWGPYVERVVFTGPQMKKYYANRLGGVGAATRPVLVKEAPLATSKPVYNNLNETHALLEWQAYSTDYELFIVEIKLFMLSGSSVQTNYSRYEFEVYAYSNRTSLVINKSEKKLQQRSSLVGGGVGIGGGRVSSALSQPVGAGTSSNIICQFRVFAFNSVSISEPSAVSDLVQIKRMLNPDDPSSTALNVKELLNTSSQSLYYLNWWFLVIIALSGLTVIVFVVLVLILRGKNKKFLMKRRQSKQHLEHQHKMNTIKMMKLNGGSNIQLDANGIPVHHVDPESTLNANSIYLAGSNQQLILTNATNTLNRSSFNGGGGNVNANYNNSNQITLYELRQSKRGNLSVRGGIGNESCQYASGTIKTATYVSPNGTLSRVNIVSNEDQQQQQMFTNRNNDMFDTNNFNTLKQEQLNAIRSNPRHLNNLIGLSGGLAQPNDYSTSGQIGAMLLGEDDQHRGHLQQQQQLQSSNLYSINSQNNNNSKNLGQYLMPMNANHPKSSELIDEALNVGHLERSGSRQHLYFQHMPIPANNTTTNNNNNNNNNNNTNTNIYGGAKTNLNFNYSSSDSTDTTNPDQQQTSTPSSSNFGHHVSSSIYNMSSRNIYTTNSFGRNALANTTNTNNYNYKNTNTTTTTTNNNNNQIQQQSQTTVLQNTNNLPPPPPSLLTSSIIADQSTPPAIQSNINAASGMQGFDARRLQANYMSTSNNLRQPQQLANKNTYLDHQQVMQQVGQNKALTIVAQQASYYQTHNMMQQQQEHQQQQQKQQNSPPPPPSPLPPPPLPPMPPAIPASAQPSYTKASPFIGKKPLEPYQPPEIAIIHTNLIAKAASSTIEAMNALHEVATNTANNGAGVINNLKQKPLETSNNAESGSKISSISINLNGDRVMMNNVAGSRRPLASGAGYSNF